HLCCSEVSISPLFRWPNSVCHFKPKNTAVRSPESNGIAESFVKTIKRDYISIMPKPDGLTAAKNLAEAFEHYNEWHPHSALGYRSPREYLRQRACNGLSDNRCLEI
ncbi:integrase core domain-containing protein, partial [Shigella boydii]|uniref:integrase core domain-containing protein n=2 Tax=Shigella boydii TaxID=621 RepID=UPI003F4982DD